jgi:hypothetical protein
MTKMRVLSFAMMLFILAGGNYSRAGQSPPISGEWVSKFRTALGGGAYSSSKFIFNLPSFTWISYTYNSNSGDAFLTYTIKGLAKITKSKIYNKIFNIDIDVTDETLLVTRQVPQLELLKISDCAKVNVPLDLLANDCWHIMDQIRKTKKLFEIFELLPDDSMFWGEGVMPTKIEMRPAALQIYPYVKRR